MRSTSELLETWRMRSSLGFAPLDALHLAFADCSESRR
jgi:hypothetical protein